jgi:glyoxylase-like metal-dependent hydrolase (beta-lactamase superfamily II)
MTEQLAQPERLSPLVRRLRAPNPGPMTLTGTNSYIVGSGPDFIVIDPGPAMTGHILALAGAVSREDEGGYLKTILVTHGHPDHYPGAQALSQLTGAAVAAYSQATFPHTQDLADGATVTVSGATLTAIFTPGHAVDHLCFFLAEEKALFTGDNILGTGTTVVAPPKGNMAAYLASLRRLQTTYNQAETIYGGHGPEIKNPAAKIEEYLNHRQARQQQLMKALAGGESTIAELVERIYQDVDRRLWPAAARQVLAYLIMLEESGQVRAREVTPTADDRANESLLNPAGALDPVAAAELGISPQPTPTGHPDGQPEKLKRYSLVG